MNYCPQADVIRTRRRLVLAIIIRYNVFSIIPTVVVL
jgi:hypothetical protein